MAELVDAADSKSVFERSGSSSLPRGTILKKDLEIQGLFFRLQESGLAHDRCKSHLRAPPSVARGFIPAGLQSSPPIPAQSRGRTCDKEEPVVGENPVARELAPAWGQSAHKIVTLYTDTPTSTRQARTLNPTPFHPPHPVTRTPPHGIAAGNGRSLLAQTGL